MKLEKLNRSVGAKLKGFAVKAFLLMVAAVCVLMPEVAQAAGAVPTNVQTALDNITVTNSAVFLIIGGVIAVMIGFKFARRIK